LSGQDSSFAAKRSCECDYFDGVDATQRARAFTQVLKVRDFAFYKWWLDNAGRRETTFAYYMVIIFLTQCWQLGLANNGGSGSMQGLQSVAYAVGF
jgi:hypothetical protein